ncbi:chitin deacetylase [Actinomortierella wolfii]|nr:chitin deacetylase [Actinomortierella wolfii]
MTASSNRSTTKRATKTLFWIGSIALAVSLLSGSGVEAAKKYKDKDPSHKPDIRKMNGQISPWPKYGEKPDTNTPEVKAWVKEVDWSKVPNLPIRKVKSPGDPPECPSHVNEKDCWWTCTGCTAEDDVVDCPDQNAWGLTFDDGPEPGVTEKLLALLEEKNVTATMFVTGMKSSKGPWLLKDILAKGHHLASHTWSHSGLTTLTNEEIVAELKWTEKYIFDHTGYRVKYFRPPYGDIDNRVRAIAKQLGYKTVIWSSGWDSQDWQLEEHTITTGQIEKLWKDDLKKVGTRHKGVVSLEHDGDPANVDMARTLLDMGMKKGMKPMDIATCLHDKVGYREVPPKPVVATNKTITTTDTKKANIHKAATSPPATPPPHSHSANNNNDIDHQDKKPVTDVSVPINDGRQKLPNDDVNIIKGQRVSAASSLSTTNMMAAGWTLATVLLGVFL